MTKVEEIELHTVTSEDGTQIALEVVGDGPPLVLVGGALNDLATTLPLGTLLQKRFRSLVYDRRGRGASGDTAPYAVQREIEDFAAVVEAAGEPPFVFANCSGGPIVLEAARLGLPLRAAALYEPPYYVNGDRTLPPQYSERLAGFIEAGQPDEALELFMRSVVELSDEHVSEVRGSHLWAMLARLAPTLRYDDAVMGTNDLPADRYAGLDLPTLVIDGTDSPQWARNSVRALAEQLPNGRQVSLADHDHFLDPPALAPVIAAFFDEYREDREPGAGHDRSS